MALTEQRIGLMALQLLQHKMEEDGVFRLNPKEVKREIANAAKKFGLPPSDMAEFYRMMVSAAYDKVMAELEVISPRAKVGENEKFVDSIRGH